MAFTQRARCVPGGDRLLVIEPEARLYRMDLAALTAHRDRVLAEERARGGPDFHLVIAARTRLHRPIAHLYAAIWDLADTSGRGSAWSGR